MNAKLSTMIIDDEPEAIISLELLLKNIDVVEHSFSTNEPDKAVELFKQWKPDLVFVDIKMSRKDGFEVIEEIHSYNYHPYFIFTTAYDEFALKAIKAGAFEYLLKPVDSTELYEVIKKVLKDKESHNLEKRIEELEKAVQNHRKLRFNTRSGFILIHPDDIFYIEADANYSEIYFSREKRVE
jgi:two-component system LytT family response regulator